MKAKLSTTQKMALAAMLLVVNILGTRLPGLLQPSQLFGFNRITFGPSIVIFSSLILGPLFGAVVGAGGDALGWLLLGTQTGPLNFFVTILYGLLGIVPWLLLLFTKRMRTLNKHPWSLYAVSLVLWCVFIVFLYCSDVFDATFIKWNMDLLAAKITFGILSGVLLILMWVGLYFENRYYQKRILDFSSIPSPIEVAFIVMFSEIILMVFLKPLCFYLYYPLFYGISFEGQFHITYSVLVLLSIMFSFVDIPLNAFAVSWLLIFSKRFIHNYGYPVVREEGDVGSNVEDLKDSKKKLEVDETQLSDEDKAVLHEKFPIGWIVFFGIIVLLMIACIIVIACLGWPTK